MSQQTLGGRYRIEEVLGRGGMATVYRGTDTVLGRPVAIKVLASQFADNADFVARFRREAQAAARLNNPNLVAVFDTGSDDGTQFIVMEYVEGRTLAEFLTRGGRLMPERAIELAEAVSRALEYAHANGIVHRDIKPENIMVTRDGEVKVMDFGIARQLTTSETIAQTAAVLGTASYLSPEQAQGQPVDGRSDIYSLGTVLYEMLAGRPPFTGDSAVQVAYKHVHDVPEPLSHLNPDVSPQLEAVVMRAMSKNPANRYQTAGEFRADLERARRGQTVEATPLLTAETPTQVIGRPDQTAVLPPPAEGPPSGRRTAVWVIVTLLILAGLAAAGYFVAKSILASNPQQVKVPGVVGLSERRATDQLERLGFQVTPESQDTDNPDEVGHVIAQDPPEGELANKGSTVTITVGRAQKVSVPGVIGQQEDDAKAAIEDAGITVATVDPQPSDQPVGEVLDQSPAEGTLVNPDTAVNLVVSSGPETVSVPSVVCESFGQAQKDVREAGLNPVISQETRPINPLCPNGNKVAAQSPDPDTEVPAGSDVTLYPPGVETTSPPPTP